MKTTTEIIKEFAIISIATVIIICLTLLKNNNESISRILLR